MSAPRPVLDEPVRAALDEISHPVSIAASLRDRDGDLLDFRLLFVNAAAAEWTGQPRDAVVGRQVGELLPALRTSGLFEELRAVVETGKPFRKAGVRFVDAVIDGREVGGRYDMGAMRLGDGYLSAWKDIGDGDSESDELDRTLRRTHALIRLIRLESRAVRLLRPGFAT
ncbi:MAG TPA: PAS domain-containing protein [Candidatus Limnocylindrales bacterium]|nr:PAS domain-containing protein [Candidatus Limnocylindrales bacterium]